MKYLTNEDPTKVLISDIETDGLNPSRIWCAVFKNLGTGQVHQFVDKNSNDKAGINHAIKKFIEEQQRSSVTVVGHNFLSFDAPVIRRLTGAVLADSSIIDTLVLSKLYNPGLLGGHSLASYGERRGISKVAHEDWSKFSPEMLARCHGDVDLTEWVLLELQRKMSEIGFSEESCELEHKIRTIVNEQERTGFWFDGDRANDVRLDLRGRMVILEQGIHDLFPPVLKEQGTYKYRLKQDGEPTQSFLRHQEKFDEIRFNEDRTQYKGYELTSFNIGSPIQRVDRLIALGWEPDEFTPKGFPKVNEESLLRYAERTKRPEIEAIAEWLVLGGRSSMIQTWLDNLGSDSRIHGRVDTCGAASRRMTHYKPNTANIPSEANGARYGNLVRSLWGVVDPSRTLVGVDASGFQARGLCHYTDMLVRYPDIADLYINGKPHIRNSEALSEALGFPVVPGGGGAKTAFYALIFGAYDKKLGSIVKKGPGVGKKIRKILYENCPGIEEATREIVDEWHSNRGLIACIDGGFVRPSSEHSCLNYKIQSLEAVIMKKAAVLMDEEIRKRGWDVREVGFIHDEIQFDCSSDIGSEWGPVATGCIVSAGEYYNLKVPLAGDWKEGRDWSETH